MPKFVIEREIPGAGNLTEDQLREVSLRSTAGARRTGAEDPMAPQLRHRRQSLLRLSRA